MKHWHLYFFKVIKGKEKGPLATCLRPFLRLLSWGFRCIVITRNWAFDQGWLKCYYPPVPLVISVGNIVAGGTGKTPVSLKVAQEFYQDYTIAILSRGYRSKAEKLSHPTLLSNGKGPIHPACYCGDEPYLLSKNLPKALVYVGRNRGKSSQMAVQAGAQLILLDDGLQHRRLARDLDIVVMDAADPFGCHQFLPLGLLRDSQASLARADLIILNHVQDLIQYETMVKAIQKYTNAGVVGTRMVVEKVCDMQDQLVASLQEKSLGIFCGIAQPDNFKNTVVQLGINVVADYYLSDHAQLTVEDLQEFALKCKKLGAEALICTEKDRVKISENFLCVLPIYWVKTELIITEGKHHWDAFIHDAKNVLKRRI